MVKSGDSALLGNFEGTISSSMIIAETARTERSPAKVADFLWPSYFLVSRIHDAIPACGSINRNVCAEA